MIQHGNLAGEWVIGGVEAKGFAFVLVFLGLEAFVARPLESGMAAAGGRRGLSRPRRRLGRAGDRHRLGPLAMGRTFALQNGQPRRGRRPPLRSLWLGLAGGLILSLPGLVPALLLNAGADAAMARRPT